jgi:uncharacterized SAM-binding protein YcdF (DUF218 family)
MHNIKRKAGVFLLICSFILLTFGFNISLTGNFVSRYFSNNFILSHLIGLILLLLGAILFLQKTSLDAIIIPTGGEEKNLQRTKRGVEEKAKYYLISGYIDKNKPIKESQTAGIYNELRKYGIKPSEMKIESNAKDSLDNIVYSMKKLKGLKRIGIVSYPEHLKRFEYIINKAKKEGLVDEDVEIINIPTDQTSKEKVYGLLANIKEKYRLRNGIEKAKENKTGILGTMIKKVVDRGATEE